jgi:hypothetical protein
MRAVIAPLAYGGSITLWAHMVQASHVITEKYDHYQKQTQRNRLYIHGANGKLMLSVPVKHLGREGHQNYNEVQIDNQFSWQAQHWKSLEVAYRSSPYFEFYEDELAFLYQACFTHLYEFNHAFFKVLEKLVGLSFEHSFTKSYEKEVPCLDLRSLQDVKSNSVYADLVYTQVFEDKNGFIPNLSILDLLFNQGPECLSLLKNCRLPKKL